MKKLFETSRQESTRTRNIRWVYNIWPCLWCTGSKVNFYSGDYRELHVSLDLNIRTRNRVGTVYGGSIYSSVDAYYMLMLMEVLGKDYIVWDKGASMKFVRPITGKVKCRFLITDEVVAEIKQKVAEGGEYSFDVPLKYEDEQGQVYATFIKTIYTADKTFYKKKLAEKNKKA